MVEGALLHLANVILARHGVRRLGGRLTHISLTHIPYSYIVEVTEVVKKLPTGKAPGVNEIHPEMLKALHIVLSWLTPLSSVIWISGTGLVLKQEGQEGVFQL